jgi:FAD/FMN-containing dehydrogenase
MLIESWGRLIKADHLIRSLDLNQPWSPHIPSLAYGNGRSYGDVCLNPGGALWLTRENNRFISFDAETGLLECESGVLLQDIQKTFVPRGWMLPVTPGTQFITVGGAIANDVHGKNHHQQGSFSHHIESLILQRSDKCQFNCSLTNHADWFSATVGGLGLTGVIISAKIRLRRVSGPWLNSISIPFENLSDFFTLSDEAEKDWEYNVSWIDCSSSKNYRGIFFKANHSSCQKAPKKRKVSLGVRIQPPISLINQCSLKVFNSLYFRHHARHINRTLQDYEQFFYPLDHVHQWNLIYGPRGFYQYQCVVPRDRGEEHIAALLYEISKAKTGSFLAVLKTFGKVAPIGMLSFPREGVTLALDFPNLGSKTLDLFNRLDHIVRNAQGCIYPAKDSRMPIDLFLSGYPKWKEFQHYRDPSIDSAFARRMSCLDFS